ncbi:hypothetical protein WJX72_002973 [[Myrmecia] bisecta]|uniref:Uncharacterized protein n=1 Tax=[Myrmecia] bisecta TaxID=41462 RepID=A0AAW1R6L9_9CHLO
MRSPTDQIWKVFDYDTPATPELHRTGIRVSPFRPFPTSGLDWKGDLFSKRAGSDPRWQSLPAPKLHTDLMGPVTPPIKAYRGRPLSPLPQLPPPVAAEPEPGEVQPLAVHSRPGPQPSTWAQGAAQTEALSGWGWETRLAALQQAAGSAQAAAQEARRLVAAQDARIGQLSSELARADSALYDMRSRLEADNAFKAAAGRQIAELAARQAGSEREAAERQRHLERLAAAQAQDAKSHIAELHTHQENNAAIREQARARQAAVVEEVVALGQQVERYRTEATAAREQLAATVTRLNGRLEGEHQALDALRHADVEVESHLKGEVREMHAALASLQQQLQAEKEVRAQNMQDLLLLAKRLETQVAASEAKAARRAAALVEKNELRAATVAIDEKLEDSTSRQRREVVEQLAELARSSNADKRSLTERCSLLERALHEVTGLQLQAEALLSQKIELARGDLTKQLAAQQVQQADQQAQAQAALAGDLRGVRTYLRDMEERLDRQHSQLEDMLRNEVKARMQSGSRQEEALAAAVAHMREDMQQDKSKLEARLATTERKAELLVGAQRKLYAEQTSCQGALRDVRSELANMAIEHVLQESLVKEEVLDAVSQAGQHWAAELQAQASGEAAARGHLQHTCSGLQAEQRQAGERVEAGREADRAAHHQAILALQHQLASAVQRGHDSEAGLLEVRQALQEVGAAQKHDEAARSLALREAAQRAQQDLQASQAMLNSAIADAAAEVRHTEQRLRSELHEGLKQLQAKAAEAAETQQQVEARQRESDMADLQRALQSCRGEAGRVMARLQAEAAAREEAQEELRTALLQVIESQVESEAQARAASQDALKETLLGVVKHERTERLRGEQMVAGDARVMLEVRGEVEQRRREVEQLTHSLAGVRGEVGQAAADAKLGEELLRAELGERIRSAEAALEATHAASRQLQEAAAANAAVLEAAVVAARQQSQAQTGEAVASLRQELQAHMASEAEAQRCLEDALAAERQARQEARAQGGLEGLRAELRAHMTAQLAEAQQQWKAEHGQIKSEMQALASPGSANSAEMEGLAKRLTAFEAQMEAARVSLTAQVDMGARAEEKVAALRGQLAEQVKGQVAEALTAGSAAGELSKVQARVEELSSRLGGLGGEVARVAQQVASLEAQTEDAMVELTAHLNDQVKAWEETRGEDTNSTRQKLAALRDEVNQLLDAVNEAVNNALAAARTDMIAHVDAKLAPLHK